MMQSTALSALHRPPPSNSLCAGHHGQTWRAAHNQQHRVLCQVSLALQPTPTEAALNSTSASSSGRSSHNSSSHNRRSLRLQPLRLDEVWYLGYGSNMNPQVLTGRRRVRPRQSVPCHVPGYHLSFGVQGFPWAEPGFATISPCRGSCDSPLPLGAEQPAVQSSSSWRTRMCAGNVPCLHAVLHRISKQEWEMVKASEGVALGSENSGVGYQVVEVDCVLYDDATTVKAVTLQAAPSSLHRAERAVQPSARYLRLLQAGGRHHGLDSHYQAYLDSLQAYQPPSPLQAAIGSAASGAVLLSAAYTAVPAYLLSRAAAGSSSSGSTAEHTGSSGEVLAPSAATDAAGSSQDGVLQEEVNKNAAGGSGSAAASAGSSSAPPEGLLPFLRWYTGSSQQLVWDVHDRLAPWLGSGSSVEKQ